MRSKIIIILFELAVIFEGCNRRQSHNEISIKGEPLSNGLELRGKLNDSLYRIMNALNIQAIKNTYGRGSTSTLLNKSESMYLFRPDSVGFYGEYFFINPTANDEQPFSLKAVIFSNKKPWSYSDDGEKLIEFTSYCNDISLLNNLKVGMPKDEVLISLGKPNFQGVDYFGYRDELGAVLMLKFKNNRVFAIKLGLYKDEELDVLGEAITKNF
jgi:hypothetical protein